MVRLASCIQKNAILRCFKCSSQLLLKMIISSKYAAQKHSKPDRSLVTILEKVAGAFHEPQCMYHHWKCQKGVTNANIGTDFSPDGTRVMSSLVRYLALPKQSNKSSTRGNGNGSGTEVLLTLQKSVHNLCFWHHNNWRSPSTLAVLNNSKIQQFS